MHVPLQVALTRLMHTLHTTEYWMGYTLQTACLDSVIFIEEKGQATFLSSPEDIELLNI